MTARSGSETRKKKKVRNGKSETCRASEWQSQRQHFVESTYAINDRNVLSCLREFRATIFNAAPNFLAPSRIWRTL